MLEKFSFKLHSTSYFHEGAQPKTEKKRNKPIFFLGGKTSDGTESWEYEHMRATKCTGAVVSVDSHCHSRRGISILTTSAYSQLW